MINVGIIGTSFGLTQAIAFNGIQGSKTCAICGGNFEKTQRLAKENNIEKAYRDYRELLADPKIDLVSLAVPNNLHREMFLEALKYNKHIIQEKPAALTSNEIDELIKVSKNYPKLIVVDHPLRFNPVVTYVKKIISDGKLGDVTNIQISQYTNYGSDENNPHRWMDLKEFGGGQTLLMGTHLIDIGRFLVDMPKVKDGNIFKQNIREQKPDQRGKMQPCDVEEQITGNILFDNNVNYSFFNTMYSFGYKNFEMRILGSKGIILYDDIEGLRVSFKNSQALHKVEIDDHLSHINAGRSFVSKSFKFFAEALVKDLNGEIKEPTFCTLEDAKENLKFLEKLHNSK